MSVEHIQEQLVIITKSRCEDLINFAKNKGWFKADFVEKMYDRCEKGWVLSDKQITAIENMHNKFCN